jgi:hypothetical protein
MRMLQGYMARNNTPSTPTPLLIRSPVRKVQEVRKPPHRKALEKLHRGITAVTPNNGSMRIMQ